MGSVFAPEVVFFFTVESGFLLATVDLDLVAEGATFEAVVFFLAPVDSGLVAVFFAAVVLGFLTVFPVLDFFGVDLGVMSSLIEFEFVLY